jgi:hypothetical protein
MRQGERVACLVCVRACVWCVCARVCVRACARVCLRVCVYVGAHVRAHARVGFAVFVCMCSVGVCVLRTTQRACMHARFVHVDVRLGVVCLRTS